MPFPASGISTLATVPSRLVSTLIGGFISSGRERLPLEIGDHRADGCGVDVVCLDRDDGRIGCAGEGVDDSFDRLDCRAGDAFDARSASCGG